MTKTNPWALRFEGMTREVMFERAIRHGAAVERLMDMSIEDGCLKLEAALKQVYFPSDQCVDLLGELLARQREHCKRIYSDVPAFLNALNQGVAERLLPDFGRMTLLTGHAGVGKSSLIEALRRVQPPDLELETGPYSGVFPLISTLSCKVHASASAKDILTVLSGQEGSPRVLVSACRAKVFRSGICAVVVDEFQFATQSAAHARVTQLLMSLGYIGVPVIYAANFSLISRLVKRPQEDQHRLLSDPIVLYPEACDSRAWHETLSMMQAVAPDVFVFSVKRDAELIHRLTFGINRNLVYLLVTAFRACRAQNSLVGVSELEAAYSHIKYASFKRDVEALVRQTVTGQSVRGRADLWCDIPLPKTAQAELTEKLQKDRVKALSLKKLEASMTKDEREAHRALQSHSKKPTRNKAPVIPLKKRHELTAAELAENTGQAFQELLD